MIRIESRKPLDSDESVWRRRSGPNSSPSGDITSVMPSVTTVTEAPGQNVTSNITTRLKPGSFCPDPWIR